MASLVTVPFNVAMAILIGGQYWPMPPATELTCQAATGLDYSPCGKPATFLRKVAGHPTAAWMLVCGRCTGGVRHDWLTPIPVEAQWLAS